MPRPAFLPHVAICHTTQEGRKYRQRALFGPITTLRESWVFAESWHNHCKGQRHPTQHRLNVCSAREDATEATVMQDKPAHTNPVGENVSEAPIRDDESFAGLGLGAEPQVDEWLEMAEATARELADRLGTQVQEHPVRSLALAGAAGFLLASMTRSNMVPAMLKSGVGIAAAVVVRQLAEQGLSRLGFDQE